MMEDREMHATAHALNQLMVFLAATGLMAAGWGYIVLPESADYPLEHKVTLP